MKTSSVPLDPDLFNPDIVGNSFRLLSDQDPSAFYPAEDDPDWDSDQNVFNFDTDDDEPDPPARSYRPSASLKSKRIRSEQDEQDDEDDDDDDNEEDEGSDEDDGSDQELDPGDLRRLIGAIHHRDVNQEGGSHGILGENWDRSMEQELNELREAEEALKPGRIRKSKMRGEPELSVEVLILLGRANLCFIEKKYDEAIPLFEEIVRIEPMCKMAWNNLGAIHQEMGNFERSSQFRIIAAHLTVKSADLWKELASESRQQGLLSQAIYCYSEAIKAGKSDVESMWDRSYLLFEIGRPRQALAGYLSILKISPHNPDVLREVAHLCATTDEKEQPIKLLKEAFKHYQSIMPSPSAHWLQTSGFGLEHIQMLVGLLMTFNQTGPSSSMTIEEEEQMHEHNFETIKLIKHATRWLQGRSDPNQPGFLDWDLLEDDREFDPIRQTRDDWESVNDMRYENSPTYPLDHQLRTYLGICRLFLADDEEAALHFELIKNLDAHENASFCMSIGDAYFECNQWDEALEFYHDLAENDSTNNPTLWHKIGKTYRKVGNLEGALECFEAINETDPLDLVAKSQLSELYEQLGLRQKALDMVNELIEMRRKARENGNGIENDSVVSPGAIQGRSSNVLATRSIAGSKSVAERRMDEELLTSKYAKTFEKLEGLSSDLCSSNQSSDQLCLMTEYVKLASPLIEGFRQTSALFSSALSAKFGGLNSSTARFSAKRGDTNPPEEVAQTEVGQEFRGIQFPNWVRIFVYYAFSCAKMDRADEACEVLDHVMRAPTFRQSASMQQVLRLAYAACCYAKEDFVEVVDTIRWLCRVLVFHNDPVRLISALLSQGFQASIVFFNTNTQKWLLRQLQLIDAHVSWPSTGLAHLSTQNDQNLENDDFDEEEDQDDDCQDEEDVDCEPGTRTKARSKRSKSSKKPVGKSTKKNQSIDRRQLLDQDLEDPEDEDDSYWKPSKFKPTKLNPVFIVMFAQILSGTRSFKSAIVYYLRLQELYPHEPLLNLLLTVAYVQRAMQRQTDNRHHQIVQALAFFDHYRELRGKEFEQEVEFNLGRIYHGLGLLSLATTHYNRVLTLAPTLLRSSTSSTAEATTATSTHGKEKTNDGIDDDRTDLSNLAAYNLILIYSTCGSPDLAYQLSCQYLTV